MNTAEALVKLLEDSSVKHIFGHPGEQIIRMYQVLNDSPIEHILVRHEQSGVHAADAYGRTTGKFGVCMATAGPGALNLVMGLATAYKDSVPILALTGDNPYSLRNEDNFQSFDLPGVFKKLTIKNFNPSSPKEAVLNMKEALDILKNQPIGPIHFNLPKDILEGEEGVEEALEKPYVSNINYNYGQMNLLTSLLKSSKKPVILAGAGVIFSGATEILKDFVEENNIPVLTTYHGKGVLDEDSKLNLGLVGVRGTSLSNYAYLNSDLILVLGAKLSERTISKGDFNEIKQKIIDVNLNKNHLKGKLKIYGDVKEVLNTLKSEDLNNKLFSELNKLWIDEIYNHNIENKVIGSDDNSIPLRPQSAIKTILDESKEAYVAGDAGSHTVWAMLLAHPNKFGKFTYSGALSPMGWGLPASIGISMAHPNERVVVINGDGGFQMSIQELATIKEYNLPITICILNNSQLGIIRQWEEDISKDLRYQIDLDNPDFLAIGKAYGIDGVKANSSEKLKDALKKSSNSDSPYIIEISVREENVPLPDD